MSVDCITGPMFSGKTTEFNKKITTWVDVTGAKALIINHTFDNRDVKNIVSSHSSSYKGLSDKINVKATSSLLSIDVSEYTIIGIDEANFFDDLFESVKSWSKDGKHVVVAGIDGDFRATQFGNIADLLSISDSFVKLTAICSKCLRETESRGEVITPCNITPAPFTEKLAKDDKIRDVGGSDKYIAVCRKHHTYL
jgi:thymidine kinase